MKNNNYEKFVSFLKANDCYDEFLKNYNKDSDNNGVTLEHYCLITYDICYILGAFDWSKDIYFWVMLEKKWRKELKNS